MPNDFKFIFFGTSRFSVIILEELKAAGLTPALIVTAPDRPSGRGQKLAPPPVKLWAKENYIKHIQPDKLDGALIRQISNAGYQISILASYGKIIPSGIIKLFPRGILNVHPSLLPKYRGPSPIQSQILANDRNIGVTIMLLDEKMDHGPIVASAEYSIPNAEWPPRSAVLEERLARLGGKLLAGTIPRWLAGEIKPREQDHSEAAYTKKVTKSDGEITVSDIEKKPYETFLKIRAYDPRPGTYFFSEKGGKKIRIKIKDAVFKNGVLIITRVVPEGKNEICYEKFLHGA